MTKYKYKFEKSWQKWLSGQHLYTIVSIGIPMEVAARFKRVTFKLSCKTQAKRKKYRLTPIAFPHGNEPFNCKQNRFPHPPVGFPSTNPATNDLCCTANSLVALIRRACGAALHGEILSVLYQTQLFIEYIGISPCEMWFIFVLNHL